MSATAGTAEGLQPKQIYLARRNPALSPAGFRERWRAHGTLAMGMPLWRHMVRYTQGDALDLPEQARERLPGFDASFDGISTLVYTSVPGLVEEEDDPEMPLLLKDESEVFEQLVIYTSVFAAETVDRDAGGTAAKLVHFATRAAAVGEAELAAAWERQAAALLEPGSRGDELVTALRRNARIEVEGVSEPTSSIGRFDAVTEVGFASAEDLLAAVADDGFATALRGLGAVTETGAEMTIATGELLLYGATATS